VGILSRLAQLGVGVPAELSVVGFDDIPLAAMVTPPLTTVALPTMRAGAEAVEVLLDRLETGTIAGATEIRKLPAALIVRGSTAAPPRRGSRSEGLLSQQRMKTFTADRPGGHAHEETTPA